MLDVSGYGVVALEQNALAAIGGGTDGGCTAIAYAIGYGAGWLAHKVVDAYLSAEPYLLLMAY